MPRFLRHIALFLLLLFCRAMVPDALVLELHAHTHTVHTDHTDPNKAQVGIKHKHCAVEDVFGAPFQSSHIPLNFTPVVHSTAYIASYTGSSLTSLLTSRYLRGPPQA